MKRILVYTNSSEFVARSIYNELNNRGITAFAYENGTLIFTSDVRIITSNEPARIKASAPFDKIFDRTRGALCVDLHRYSSVISVRSTVDQICDYVSKECQNTRDNGFRGGFTLKDEWNQYCKADMNATKELYKFINGTAIIPLSQQKLKPQIKDVIFNDPATIVFWSDGTKTVVKTQDNEMGDHEIYDPEKGLAMAIAKKALGNNREYYHTFLHWLKQYEKDNAATKEICKNLKDKLSKNIYELKFTPMSDAKKEAAEILKRLYEELGVITTKKHAAVQKAYDLLVKYGPTEGDMILNEVIGYLGEALED